VSIYEHCRKQIAKNCTGQSTNSRINVIGLTDRMYATADRLRSAYTLPMYLKASSRLINTLK